MKNLLNRQVINTNELFDRHSMNPRALYFYLFSKIPSNDYIGDLKGGKPYAVFKEKFGHLIEEEFRYRWFEGRDRSEDPHWPPHVLHWLQLPAYDER